MIVLVLGKLIIIYYLTKLPLKHSPLPKSILIIIQCNHMM